MCFLILCWCLHKTTKGASDKKESSAFIKLDFLPIFEVLVVQKLTDCHLPNLPEEGAPDHVIKTHLQTTIARPHLVSFSEQGTAAHLLLLHVPPGEARYDLFVCHVCSWYLATIPKLARPTLGWHTSPSSTILTSSPLLFLRTILSVEEMVKIVAVVKPVTCIINMYWQTLKKI